MQKRKLFGVRVMTMWLQWICNENNNKVFNAVATVVMIILAIIAVFVALKIAKMQRKMANQDHVNNLAFELAVDFICPFKDYSGKVKNFLNSSWRASHDTTTIHELLKILNEANLHTDFRYWEMHKGDINAALEKEGEYRSQIAKINSFIIAARKHRIDIDNIRKDMMNYLSAEKKGSVIGSLKEVAIDENTFYTEVSSRAEKILGGMEKSIEDLPKELNIKSVCRKVKNDK